MKRARFTRWYWIIVAFILFFSFVLRLPHIDRPLLDAHYFRQTQTATVVRNFYLSGIDFFHTRLDIFGDGKEQVILLEFPVYQAVVTLFSYILGFQDYVGRLVALLFAIISGIFLVKLANSLTGDKKVGLVALVFFLFNPLNYYFQQAYMIESSVVFLHILSLFLWLKYTQKRNNRLLVMATLITSIAFVHKTIYAPFLFLPILAVLFYKLEDQEFRKLRWLPAILFSLFILLIWQYYVSVTNFTNGHSNFTLSDVSQRLWNFGTLLERFDAGTWITHLKSVQNSVTKYQWPMFLVGLALLIIEKEKGRFIIFSWLLSMVFYYLIFFRIQSHDYYFMVITPIFSIIAAYGLTTLAKYAKQISFLVIIIYLFLFAYKSIQNSRLYFQIDANMLTRLNTYNSVIKSGGNILFIFPEYDWNSVYTYYTHHKGLVVAAKSVTPDLVENYVDNGYQYAIIDGVDAIKDTRKAYPDILIDYNTLLSQDGIIILDLAKPKFSAEI